MSEEKKDFRISFDMGDCLSTWDAFKRLELMLKILHESGKFGYNMFNFSVEEVNDEMP